MKGDENFENLTNSGDPPRVNVINTKKAAVGQTINQTYKKGNLTGDIVKGRGSNKSLTTVQA